MYKAMDYVFEVFDEAKRRIQEQVVYMFAHSEVCVVDNATRSWRFYLLNVPNLIKVEAQAGHLHTLCEQSARNKTTFYRRVGRALASEMFDRSNYTAAHILGLRNLILPIYGSMDAYYNEVFNSSYIEYTKRMNNAVKYMSFTYEYVKDRDKVRIGRTTGVNMPEYFGEDRERSITALTDVIVNEMEREHAY